MGNQASKAGGGGGGRRRKRNQASTSTSQQSHHSPSSCEVPGTKGRERQNVGDRDEAGEIEVEEDDLVVLLKGKAGTGPRVQAEQIVEVLQRRLRQGQRNVCPSSFTRLLSIIYDTYFPSISNIYLRTTGFMQIILISPEVNIACFVVGDSILNGV
jgi:hypothetical protein